LTEDVPLQSVGVADQLIKSSSAFASSAVSAYCEESWDVFYLHLATALEQLLKAVLASTHPSLIADGRADFDSLLHLCGLGRRAKVPEFWRAVRTISASEAVARVERLAEDYEQPTPRIALLLHVRNSLVHCGQLERGEAQAVLGDVARFASQLLLRLDISHDKYWGEAASLVLEHMRRQLSALEASYARRLQSARERLTRLTEMMEPAALGAYVAAATPVPLSSDFDAVAVECPVCGHAGELAGSPEPEWEADCDVSDGEAYVVGIGVSSITLKGDSFYCGVCGLSLPAWELPMAGMARIELTQDDYDGLDATRYFEQDLHDDPWDY